MDGLPHGPQGRITHGGGEVNEVLAMAILRSAGAKGIPEKVKARVGLCPSTIIVLAVDNPRLRRVEFQSTFRQTPRQVFFERRSCSIGPTVHYGIVSISLKGLVGVPPTHPDVEGIVAKEIGEHWTDDRPLWRAAGARFLRAVGSL